MEIWRSVFVGGGEERTLAVNGRAKSVRPADGRICRATTFQYTNLLSRKGPRQMKGKTYNSLVHQENLGHG